MHPSGFLDLALAEENRQLVWSLTLNGRNQPRMRGGFSWGGMAEFYAMF
jgi:hypothetical protein